jgi:anaerobic selenocysteine-containing dehydrogenase
MTDTDWKQNVCSLCYVNCGIEVQTEGWAITRVRGDKAPPPHRRLHLPEGAASDVLRKSRSSLAGRKKPASPCSRN